MKGSNQREKRKEERDTWDGRNKVRKGRDIGRSHKVRIFPL